MKTIATLVVSNAELQESLDLANETTILIRDNINKKPQYVQIQVRQLFTAGIDIIITYHDAEHKQLGPVIAQLLRAEPK